MEFYQRNTLFHILYNQETDAAGNQQVAALLEIMEHKPLDVIVKFKESLDETLHSHIIGNSGKAQNTN